MTYYSKKLSHTIDLVSKNFYFFPYLALTLFCRSVCLKHFLALTVLILVLLICPSLQLLPLISKQDFTHRDGWTFFEIEILI